MPRMVLLLLHRSNVSFMRLINHPNHLSSSWKFQFSSSTCKKSEICWISAKTILKSGKPNSSLVSLKTSQKNMSMTSLNCLKSFNTDKKIEAPAPLTWISTPHAAISSFSSPSISSTILKTAPKLANCSSSIWQVHRKYRKQEQKALSSKRQWKSI